MYVIHIFSSHAPAASWAPALAATCPSPPPLRDSVCDALFSIVSTAPRTVVVPVLLRLLPLHPCAGHDLSWRHNLEKTTLVQGPEGQQLRRVLAACRARAPVEAAASALQTQLSGAIEQARDVLGAAAGPAHVAWAAAHVGHDASGAHWQATVCMLRP